MLSYPLDPKKRIWTIKKCPRIPELCSNKGIKSYFVGEQSSPQDANLQGADVSQAVSNWVDDNSRWSSCCELAKGLHKIISNLALEVPYICLFV